jgi:hypothetical protein
VYAGLFKPFSASEPTTEPILAFMLCIALTLLVVRPRARARACACAFVRARVWCVCLCADLCRWGCPRWLPQVMVVAIAFVDRACAKELAALAGAHPARNSMRRTRPRTAPRHPPRAPSMRSRTPKSLGAVAPGAHVAVAAALCCAVLAAFDAPVQRHLLASMGLVAALAVGARPAPARRPGGWMVRWSTP